MFDDDFLFLREVYNSKKKHRLFDDLQGQIEEDTAIQDILNKPWTKERYRAVTCDRRRNDKKFSYSNFDSVLVFLDRRSGGTGIYKPINQIRAIQWNGSRSDLVTVLRFFARMNPSLNFRSLLVLPFPVPITGVRIDKKVHKR